MQTFFVVKGKKGVLVGDPMVKAGDRFLGQKLKYFAEGELPKRLHDRYEPVVAVCVKCSTLLKALSRGKMELLKKIEAESINQARAIVFPSPPKKDAEQSDSKKSGGKK